MSGSGSSSGAPASKLQEHGNNKVVTDPAIGASASTQPNPPAMLEEDDEFEDFPVEDWPQEEAEGPSSTATTHLWEESWDDDEDGSEEFSKQLKEEMKKVSSEQAASKS